MSRITFLGTASAVPSKEHHNSHFVVQSSTRTILVDCSGNPVVRLQEAGIDPLSITDLILTHFHPDHISGAPLLLMDLWLLGRQQPLAVYGLSDLIDRLGKMMALYQWQNWEGFYPVHFIEFPDHLQEFWIDESAKLTVSPVCHMIPGVGFNMRFHDEGFCYSSDTAPCEATIALAEGQDFLIHEATGEGTGHSSPEEAGEIAEKAGVKVLYLIHYPPDVDEAEWLKKAKSTFSGEVILAKDLMTFNLS